MPPFCSGPDVLSLREILECMLTVSGPYNGADWWNHVFLERTVNIVNTYDLRPLLLTLFNFNLSMDK